MKNGRTPKGTPAVLSCLLALGLVGCTQEGNEKNAKSQADAKASRQETVRRQGISELRRIHGVLDELRIIVEGGVPLDEFSRRLTDALLKIRDLGISRQETLAKFPEEDRPTVDGVYDQFHRAIEAYKESRAFFGGHGTGLGQSDYWALKQRFPLMPEVVSESDSVMSAHRYYPSPSILNALWQSAVEDNKIAVEWIATLDGT